VRIIRGDYVLLLLIILLAISAIARNSPKQTAARNGFSQARVVLRCRGSGIRVSSLLNDYTYPQQTELSHRVSALRRNTYGRRASIQAFKSSATAEDLRKIFQMATSGRMKALNERHHYY